MNNVHEAIIHGLIEHLNKQAWFRLRWVAKLEETHYDGVPAPRVFITTNDGKHRVTQITPYPHYLLIFTNPELATRFLKKQSKLPKYQLQYEDPNLFTNIKNLLITSVTATQKPDSNSLAFYAIQHHDKWPKNKPTKRRVRQQ